MAKRKAQTSNDATAVSSPVEQLLLDALARGDDSFQTGRLLVTYKEGAADAGAATLESQGLRVANAREFKGQAAVLADVGDADAMHFPEIGVTLVGAEAAKSRGLTSATAGSAGQMGLTMVGTASAADSPVESIDPEYFVFSSAVPPYEYAATTGAGDLGGSASQYMRGFLRAAETIARDLRLGIGEEPNLFEAEEEVTALGTTWGLVACRVPQSSKTGAGIRLAVLDTGMDTGHPDFAGRLVTGQQFVGQPVQDLHGHGTHCIGTSCGPKTPAGTTPRYGIAHQASIFTGKVLSNSGASVGGSVLAGMNWAIANGCQVISMSLGGPGGPQPAYTNAGQAALNKGLLMVAAAGNSSALTGSPANSPTIMSVASLDLNLSPSSFSNFGKIEIAAPGRDVFSAWPRPLRYNTISGTSMATPHVAGCAALWAQSSSSLRGITLWRRLQASARRLAFPATRVGAGLVQSPP